jgi:hypothetical protein
MAILRIGSRLISPAFAFQQPHLRPEPDRATYSDTVLADSELASFHYVVRLTECRTARQKNYLKLGS